MPTSCSHYFAETIRGAQRVGIDPDVLLSSVGLTRAQVFDPQWRGDVSKLAQLVQMVWFALDDEFMGLVGKKAKPGAFAMMTHVALQSSSLESAIRKGTLFYSLFTDGIRMSLDPDGEDMKFTVEFRHPEFDPEHYFLEFWLTIWYRLTGWLGGSLPPLKKATFAYPRPIKYFEEFKHMFRCSYEFDAANTALYFEREYLSQPIVRTREELKQFLSMAPLGFMMVPGDENSLSRRIRTMLHAQSGVPYELPSIANVAEQMQMTEQTLRRRLKRESTSYRMIKEVIRRDFAVQKLMESTVPIQEIAFQLGYSEPRAFTRAFREWTGFSPAQYRDRLQEHFRR
jgi:AraC-like DNA-binding protein